MISCTNIILVKLATVCINGSNVAVKILRLAKSSRAGSIAKPVVHVVEKAKKAAVVILRADQPKVHAKVSKVKCINRKVLNVSTGRKNEKFYNIF